MRIYAVFCMVMQVIDLKAIVNCKEPAVIGSRLFFDVSFLVLGDDYARGCQPSFQSIIGATEKVRSRSVIGVTGSFEKRVFYQPWRGVRVL
ncbi:hypothetical protein CVH10_08575 [Halomonas sp. ND22Bw]|uniref:hypothetical protein n=1 Tax=Halomonas sp. ND22Bw TaxID=2054178 RepID=UPI000D0AC5F4|nr:hypothetical protein CVH10_08575 [Halomonas sp. ND22Bw]